MAKLLMKGNEAIGEAAILAGCRLYFGYPITPQNEVAEYMSRRLPDVGGSFVQAESELGASNMVFGAGATGELVLTTSSSPGISLMSEALSYIAGAHVPAVFVNIVRGGPGLGGILPAQSDYLQATKGGGHGDYRLLVLAPATVQEAVDLTMLAFRLAHRYLCPVLVLGDGNIGQMMEPVEFPKSPPAAREGLPPKESFGTTGRKGRPRHIVRSLFLDPDILEENCRRLAAKYAQWKAEEVRHATYNTDGPMKMLLVAYGTTARICQTVVDELKADGIEVGLLRPITLYPFPEKPLVELAERAGRVLCVEMSLGQMVEDVRAFVDPKIPVDFYGRTGGNVPSPDEVIAEIRKRL